MGTFRAYCVAYLREHPKVHKDMTLLVRQRLQFPMDSLKYMHLPMTPLGYPTKTSRDIFDHLLSVLPEFRLSAYQSPSGVDLEKIGLD